MESLYNMSLSSVIATISSYIPSAPDVAAVIPNFLTEDGNPRYGLIAVTTGLVTGASYFILRASFTNRQYPLHLLNRNRNTNTDQPTTDQTITPTTPIDTTTPITNTPQATSNTTMTTSINSTPTISIDTPTSTDTVTTTRTGPSIGPVLLLIVVSVALVLSINSAIEDQNIPNINGLHFWTWASQFPLFLPLFYTAVGLIFHQHFFAPTLENDETDMNMNMNINMNATTPPFEIIDASNAAGLIKTAAPLPSSSPPPPPPSRRTNITEASKQQDIDDETNNNNNNTTNMNTNTNAFRGESKGETKNELPDSPSRSRRGTMVVNRRSSMDINDVYTDLDEAWIESEKGNLDKKQVLNQVLTALEQQKCSPIGLLWRASRAESNIAAWDPNIAIEAKQIHVKHALEYAQKALNEMDNTTAQATTSTVSNSDLSATHKFMAICLGQKTQFLSNPKDKLVLASEIKEHIDKGIQFNANDPMLWYMRGSWYYNIADISYTIRYGASWLTGVILKADFKDALNDFKQAASIDESFYADNYFMQARTMQKLLNDDIVSIKLLLQKGIDMTCINPSTKILQQKAKSLLEKL